MRLVADIFLLVGALFALLGALGLLRMPDVYNRIQAGTKAVTLGTLAFLTGIALLQVELYVSWGEGAAEQTRRFSTLKALLAGRLREADS